MLTALVLICILLKIISKHAMAVANNTMSKLPRYTNKKGFTTPAKSNRAKIRV